MRGKNVSTAALLLALEFRRLISGRPYIAELDVTDSCNLRCAHCYHFHGKSDFRKEEVPAHEWERRLNRLYAEGVRLVLLVGGEPALRPDVLMLAQSVFPYVAVISNGTIRIPETFSGRIFVSLDGMERTNDAIRGAGVFSRVLENYAGDPRAIINMTVMESNYRELEKVVNLARSIGLRGVVCNVCAPGIDYNGPMHVARKSRPKIIGEMKRVKSRYPRTFLLSRRMIRWYERPDHRGRCYWGDEVLHLDVSWRRRRCFAKADCSNCGCFAGTLQNPLSMLMSLRESRGIFFA